MRMRTICSAFEELKCADPKSALTLSGLRRLVATGSVSSVKIGRRILINYDGLMEFLRNPPVENEAADEYGQVRKIQ